VGHLETGEILKDGVIGNIKRKKISGVPLVNIAGLKTIIPSICLGIFIYRDK
jgi:hypothetical protein